VIAFCEIEDQMPFNEIENLKPLKESADKTRMFQALLKGQDLSLPEFNLNK
jgi:hypothetical protein